MNSKHTALSVFIFLLCAAGIVLFAFYSKTGWPTGWPFNARHSSEKEHREQYYTRVIVPAVSDSSNPDAALIERAAYEENYEIKGHLADGEIAISILNYDFDNDAIEEQIVAFRNLLEAGSPISIAFFVYDGPGKAYRRLWEAPTTATMQGTFSWYIDDLLGDRSPCIIITGMNGQGEHTMTVFRKNPVELPTQPFKTIAAIQIDGSITVQETERPLAYQQGIARGQPFTIAVSGPDITSDNMLDRIEMVYTYNPIMLIYQRGRINRIPGSQIEQRRLREILTGEPKKFENFINDLWYHVSPQGTIDHSQYIYFDPEKREIIFFGDETQQVFVWQQSTATRYGLYISSQNISVTTLRRFLDIEMESLDSIRIRVVEDVRLKIGLSASWDGSYRRAKTAIGTQAEKKNIRPYINAVYDSSIGRLRFHANGEYELSFSGSLTKGRYAFFRAGGNDLLELRPESNGAAGKGATETRYVYRLSDNTALRDTINLSRVRLGSSGVFDLHEAHIILTKAQE